MHKKTQSQRALTKPIVNRINHCRVITVSQFSDERKKPPLSRCGSMGLLQLKDPLYSIESDIANTDVETISLEKLQQWCKELLSQCELMENIPQHKYAFKVVSHTDILQRQIDEEIHNREKLNEQTSQMMHYNEMEINQLVAKIDVLEKQLYK